MTKRIIGSGDATDALQVGGKFANLIRLVPRAVDRRPVVDGETVQALEQLLDLARRGNLIGLAFAGMTEDGYFVDTAGEAYRRPAFASGCVNALAAELLDRMRGSRGAQ